MCCDTLSNLSYWFHLFMYSGPFCCSKSHVVSVLCGPIGAEQWGAILGHISQKSLQPGMRGVGLWNSFLLTFGPSLVFKAHYCSQSQQNCVWIALLFPQNTFIEVLQWSSASCDGQAHGNTHTKKGSLWTPKHVWYTHKKAHTLMSFD